MPSTETPFTIEDWEPHAVDESAPDLALGRVSFRKTYKGDDLTKVGQDRKAGGGKYETWERKTKKKKTRSVLIGPPIVPPYWLRFSPSSLREPSAFFAANGSVALKL